MGSDVWDKVPNKYGFFLTPSLILILAIAVISENMKKTKTQRRNSKLFPVEPLSSPGLLCSTFMEGTPAKTGSQCKTESSFFFQP